MWLQEGVEGGKMQDSQEEKERLNESEANYFQALDFQHDWMWFWILFCEERDTADIKMPFETMSGSVTRGGCYLARFKMCVKEMLLKHYIFFPFLQLLLQI